MQSGRWNEELGRYEPFSPGIRTYRSLSSDLLAQRERISPTTDGIVKYYPCKVTLADGREQDFVYVVDADDYIRAWGVWPDQDQGKREISLGDIRAIEVSPSRIPQRLAQRLYEARESGMGYVLFEVSYRGGSRSAHLSGNAVDFIQLPDGKVIDDVMDVHPHAGRESQIRMAAPEYYWCLVGKP